MSVWANNGLTRAQVYSATRTPTAPIAWRRTSTVFGTLSPTFTQHQVIALSSEYDYVCLQYENDALATTMDIAAARIAPSALYNNGYDPVDASAVAQTWQTVTFNNAGAAGSLPSPSGATASLSGIASATDITNPTRAFSDWMPIASLARADAGASLPLLFVRTLSGAANTFRCINQTPLDPDWQDPNINLGRILFCARRAGDYVTVNQSTFAGAPVLSDLIAPTSVLYLPRFRGAAVLGVGDSLTAGQLTAAYNMRGWGFLSSVALSSTTFPVEWVSEGYQGLTSTQWYARSSGTIPIIKPKVVTIQVYSGNEANNTTAIVEAAWQRAILLANLTQANGGVPVFLIPYPRSFAGATETLRQGIIARLRAMRDAGSALVIDSDAVLADPSAPNTIAPAYYVDGTHINAAGEAVMGIAATPVIAKAVRLY